MPMDGSGPIGLFGGTFDPPHLGHLILAVEARFRLGLDVVQLVVANDPWQKRGEAPLTPAVLRLEMATAAIEGHDGLEVNDVEIRRGGTTYTVDTVEGLAVEGRPITLIMGADTARGLATWHRSPELAGMVTVGVAGRAGAAAEVPLGWRGSAFGLPGVNISSTEIRRRCAAGEPIDHLVPSGALSVIEARGLYGFRR